MRRLLRNTHMCFPIYNVLTSMDYMCYQHSSVVLFHTADYLLNYFDFAKLLRWDFTFNVESFCTCIKLKIHQKARKQRQTDNYVYLHITLV